MQVEQVVGLGGAPGKACTAGSAQTIARQVTHGQWTFVRSGWLPGLRGSWATVTIPTGERKTIPFWLTPDDGMLVLQCPYTGELFNFEVQRCRRCRSVNCTCARVRAGAGSVPVGLAEQQFNLTEIDASLGANPNVQAAWAPVVAQYKAEGRADYLTLYSAGNDFLKAYKDLTSVQFGSIPWQNALAHATAYAMQGTDAGAAKQVTGLVSSAASVIASQGADQLQAENAFIGVMIATLVTTGAFSAGVGAIITAGAAVLYAGLESLVGAPPGPPKTCADILPGYQLVIGYIDPLTNSPVSPYFTCLRDVAVKGGPLSSEWRPWPTSDDPKHTMSGTIQGMSWYDFWFKPVPYTTGTWLDAWAFRRIDKSYPQWHCLECELKYPMPGPAGEFQKMFIAAWRANQVYALNGFNSASDEQVLLNCIRTWNRAHAPGDGFVFDDTSIPNEAGPIVCGDPPQYRADGSLESDPCTGPPASSYISRLTTRLKRIAHSNDPAQPYNMMPEGRVRIATGPLKTTLVLNPGYKPFPIPAPAAAAMSVPAKVATGVAVVAGGTAIGIGIWAYVTKQAYGFVAKQLYEQTAGRALTAGKKLVTRGK